MSLVLDEVREAVFDRRSLPQFRPPFGRHLASSKLDQEGLVRVDRQAPSGLAPRALRTKVTDPAARRGEVRRPPDHQRLDLPSRADDAPRRHIEREVRNVSPSLTRSVA